MEKGKWKLRRFISYFLATGMVVSTFGFGGIPKARVVEAASATTTISYTLGDSRGDTWDGGSNLKVIRKSDNQVIDTLTIAQSSVTTKTGTVTLDTGTEYKLVWYVGGNYDNECSFTITDARGGVIYSKSQGTYPGNGEVLKTFTAISAKENQTITALDVIMTYGDSAKAIGATTSGDGTLSYSVTSGTDVVSVDTSGNITALNAGSAQVKITAAETNSYYADEKTISVTVNKANPAIGTAPSAKTDLTYSGAAQALVNAGTISNTAISTASTENKLQYRISNYIPNDTTTGPNAASVKTAWGDSIPTGTAAGTYSVQYRIVDNTSDTTVNFNPNKNSTDEDASAIDTVSVTIAKKAVTVTPAGNQSKIYGMNDPVFAYTVDGAFSGDLTSGKFTSGALGRAAGEDYSKNGYVYTLGTLQTSNANNYTISLAENSPVFMINRKNITSEGVDIGLLHPDTMDGTIYQYYYLGRRIQPEISLIYSGAEVNSIKNENLQLNKDYNVTDGDTVIEYINKDSENYFIKLRGTGNYIGVTQLDWRVIRKNLGTITDNGYTGTYDGNSHKITVDLSQVAEEAKAEVTYIYDSASDTKYDASNWDASKASATNPEFKDVRVNANNETISYKVYYKVHSEEKDGSGQYIYNDVYGSQTVTINKKDVNLKAVEKTKVYDKDKTTDPELTYYDYAAQMVGEEKLTGVKLSRASSDADNGQNAGSYAITFNLDEINKQNTNYNVTATEAVNFIISPRPVKVSAGDYTKIYSEENPNITLTIEQDGADGVAENEGLLKDDVLVDPNTVADSISVKDGKGTAYTFDRFIDAGEYTLENGTIANPNYTIAFTNGTLKVEQKDISAEDSNVVILYNGTRTDSVFNYTGKTITPEFSISDKQNDIEYANYDGDTDYEVTGVYEASDYGVYKVTIKGIHNYKGELNGQWAILPAVDEECEYDGLEHQISFNLSAALADNTVIGIKYSKTKPASNAEYTLDECPEFVDAGEYTVYYGIYLNPDEYGEEIVVPGSAKLTINKKKLTITVPTAIDKVYDGTTAATFAPITNANGLVNGETIVFNGVEGAFEDANVAYDADNEVTTKKVTVSKAQLEAATATVTRAATAVNSEGGTIANYDVTYNFDEDSEIVTTSAKITPKPVSSIAASADATKVYDGTTDAKNAKYSIVVADPAVPGETIKIKDFAGTYNSKDVLDASKVSFSGTFYVEKAAATEGAEATEGILSNYSYGGKTLTADYKLADQAATITAKPVTATVTAENKTYDGNTTATATVTINTGIEGETYTRSGYTATFDTKDVVLTEGTTFPYVYSEDKIVAKTVTITGGTDTTSDDTLTSNYAVTVPTTTAKILPADITVNITPADKIYDGNAIAVGTAISITGVGEEKFKLKDETLLKFDSKDVAYLDGSVANKTISYTGTFANIQNDVVAYADATIEKLQNYKILDMPTAEAKINPRKVELKADNKLRATSTETNPIDIVYGEEAEELTYQTLAIAGNDESGMVQGETLSSLEIAREVGSDVGTYAITFNDDALKTANTNYDITITNGTYTIVPAEVTISEISAKDKVYDGTDTAEVNVTISGVNEETFIVPNLAGTFASKDVVYEEGEVAAQTVTLTGTINEGTGKFKNYTYNGIAFTADTKIPTTTAKITPKAATLTVNADQGKVYGDEDPELTYTEEGLVTVDGKTETLKGVVLTRVNGKDVGKYDISVNEDDVNKANTNYAITYVTTNKFDITTRPVTVTVDANQSKVYDTQDVDAKDLKYTVEEFDAENSTGLVEGDELDVAIAKDVGTDVGTYDVTLSQADGANANYDVTFVDGTYEITPKAITVTAEDKTKTYGDKDPKLTWTVSELAGDETKDVLGIEISRAAGENAGTYKISTTETANKNYDVTYVDGKLTINKADATSTPKKDSLKTTKASSTSSKDAAISGVDDTMEYSTDGGKTWKSVPKGATSITGLSAGNVQVRTKGDANHNPSAAVTVTVPQKAAQSAPSSVTVKAVNATGTGINNGTINGVDDTMEYSADGGKTWTAVPKGATSITGLAPGIYQVRRKATADSNASEATVIVIGVTVLYSNEWAEGQWYGADGNVSYKPQGSWKSNSIGKWYEDASGWYPVSQWQKIDGLWYYFDANGYMASSEWIDGYWLDSDGAWRYAARGSWTQDENGWWYGDTSGWYAGHGWQKIDGKYYFFNESGYMLSSQYVGDDWVGSDGAWVAE